MEHICASHRKANVHYRKEQEKESEVINYYLLFAFLEFLDRRGGIVLRETPSYELDETEESLRTLLLSYRQSTRISKLFNILVT